MLSSSSPSGLASAVPSEGFLFRPLLPVSSAPVAPLGPADWLTSAAGTASAPPSSLLLFSPLSWSSSSFATAAPIVLAQPAPLQALPADITQLLSRLQPLTVPAMTVAIGRTATVQQQLVARAAAVHDGLVISLKEDSERRRERETSQRQTRVVSSAQLLLSEGDEAASPRPSGSASHPPSDIAADGGQASSPPPSLSEDTLAASASSSSTSTVLPSLPVHSPALGADKAEVSSPPTIGLLKEPDATVASLPAGGKLLASSDLHFGLDDDVDELSSLSPPAVFTPPRRGSFCGGARRTHDHEPLDALAYLQSLTSTPCSSQSDQSMSPGAVSPSSLTSIPPLATASSLLSRPAASQPLTAVTASDVLRHYQFRAPLRDIQNELQHYAAHIDGQQHRRVSLYTVAASDADATIAKLAALRAVQQRTIAAKLRDSDICQQPSDDSDGEAAAIIVRQPLHAIDGTSQRTTSKPNRKRKRSTAGSESRTNRKRKVKDSAKEDRPPQQCEQCWRRQADSAYGTGRFCGPKCARTYSINKRSTHSQPLSLSVRAADDRV